MKKIKVHVWRTDNQLKGIKTFFKEINLNRYIKCNDKVIIKPNFVAPRQNKSGATTSLELIKSVSDTIHNLNAIPYLFEMPGMEFKFEEVYNYLDIYNFCKNNKLKLLNPEKVEFIKVAIPGAKFLKTVEIPKILLEYKIINLPVMKTHVITQVTLGCKNIMGFCSDKSKRKMHIIGIHRAIADLNLLINPDYTIIDGINSMDGDGAVYGDLKRTNILIGSENTFAADAVACDFMNIDLHKVQYLKRIENNRQVATEIIGSFEPQKFSLPRHKLIYKFFYWSLYVVDLLFNKFFNQHFNEFLYKSGYVGSHPKIKYTEYCKTCKKCINNCSVDAINSDFMIDSKTCLRCLDCVDVCPKNNIIVKGFSKPGHEKKYN